MLNEARAPLLLSSNTKKTITFIRHHKIMLLIWYLATSRTITKSWIYNIQS